MRWRSTLSTDADVRGAVVRSVRHSDRRFADKQQTRAMEKASSCHKHAVAVKRITTLTILLNSLGLNGVQCIFQNFELGGVDSLGVNIC